MIRNFKYSYLLFLFWLFLVTLQGLKLYFLIEASYFLKQSIQVSILEFILFIFYFVFKDKKYNILNFLFLFTLFFYLYSHLYVILYFFVIEFTLLAWITETDIINAFFISTITFSLLINAVFFHSIVFFKKKDIRLLTANKNKQLNSIDNFPIANKYFFFIFFSLSILAIYYAFKYFNLPTEIKLRRGAVLKILWSGIGVYIKAIMVGVTVFYLTYLFNVFNKISVKKRILTLLMYLPIFFFWVAHSMAGNRRELSSIIIFIFLFIVLKQKISFKKIILFGTIIFSLMIYTSYTRGGDEQSDRSIYFNSLGEFVAPYHSLIETIRIDDNHYYDYYLGTTYLYPVYAFIPRDLWPGKPLTMASQFSKEADLGFGLGYSPMTESYINWGKLSVFFLPISFLVLSLLFREFDKKLPFFYFFLIINVLNLNRSELGTVFIEIIFMYIPFYLLYKTSSKKQ
jgi:oligosaccharide repeat unit polymerase